LPQDSTACAHPSRPRRPGPPGRHGGARRQAAFEETHTPHPGPRVTETCPSQLARRPPRGVLSAFRAGFRCVWFPTHHHPLHRAPPCVSCAVRFCCDASFLPRFRPPLAAWAPLLGGHHAECGERGAAARGGGPNAAGRTRACAARCSLAGVGSLCCLERAHVAVAVQRSTCLVYVTQTSDTIGLSENTVVYATARIALLRAVTRSPPARHRLQWRCHLTAAPVRMAWEAPDSRLIGFGRLTWIKSGFCAPTASPAEAATVTSPDQSSYVRGEQASRID
jgi:hypothetical protein